MVETYAPADSVSLEFRHPRRSGSQSSTHRIYECNVWFTGLADQGELR